MKTKKQKKALLYFAWVVVSFLVAGGLIGLGVSMEGFWKGFTYGIAGFFASCGIAPLFAKVFRDKVSEKPQVL